MKKKTYLKKGYVISRTVLTVILCVMMSNLAKAGDQPSFLHSSFLNGFNYLSKDGSLSMDQTIQAFDLPTVKNDDRFFDFDQKRGGGQLTSVIYKDGSKYATLKWYARKDGNKYLLQGYMLEMNGKEQSTTFIPLNQPGNYTLESSVNGKTFNRFDFSVIKCSNGEYALEGDWNDYAYLYYPNASPSSSLSFKLWLNNPDGGTKSADVRAVLYNSAGEELCANTSGNGKTSFNLTPQWVRYDLPMNDNGGPFYASNILNNPGNYKITVTMDGSHYGDYPFTVSGGQIEPISRQLSSAGSSYINGGVDAFWVKRQ